MLGSQIRREVKEDINRQKKSRDAQRVAFIYPEYISSD